MKCSNLFPSAQTGCLLVGASTTAMAAIDCSSVYLAGVIDDDIIIDGPEPCTIEDATVFGDIIAMGSDDINITTSTVEGKIRIFNTTSAYVFGVIAESIRLRRNQVAIIHRSVATEDIRVNGNEIARVKRNTALDALTWRNNTNLHAVLNTTGPLGAEDCVAPQAGTRHLLQGRYKSVLGHSVASRRCTSCCSILQ